jgi:hypothetical protein
MLRVLKHTGLPLLGLASWTDCTDSVVLLAEGLVSTPTRCAFRFSCIRLEYCDVTQQ